MIVCELLDSRNGVVRFESIMKMRNKLGELGKIEKEKGISMGKDGHILNVDVVYLDPEEFLNMLFKHVLHARPFISIRYV